MNVKILSFLAGLFVPLPETDSLSGKEKMLYEEKLSNLFWHRTGFAAALAVAAIAAIGSFLLRGEQYVVTMIFGIGLLLLAIVSLASGASAYRALKIVRKQTSDRRKRRALTLLEKTAREYGAKLLAAKYPHHLERAFYRAVLHALDCGNSISVVVKIVQDSTSEVRRFKFDLEYTDEISLKAPFGTVGLAKSTLTYLNAAPEVMKFLKTDKANCSHSEHPWAVGYEVILDFSD